MYKPVAFIDEFLRLYVTAACRFLHLHVATACEIHCLHVFASLSSNGLLRRSLRSRSLLSCSLSRGLRNRRLLHSSTCMNALQLTVIPNDVRVNDLVM
jgi:hypothetical protein